MPVAATSRPPVRVSSCVVMRRTIATETGAVDYLRGKPGGPLTQATLTFS
jgi:hypothetical protein